MNEDLLLPSGLHGEGGAGRDGDGEIFSSLGDYRFCDAVSSAEGEEAVVTQFRQLAERSVHGGLSPTALPGAASPRALPEFAKIDTFLSSRI